MGLKESTDVDGGLLGDDLVGQGVERGEVQGGIHVGQQGMYCMEDDSVKRKEKKTEATKQIKTD